MEPKISNGIENTGLWKLMSLLLSQSVAMTIEFHCQINEITYQKHGVEKGMAPFCTTIPVDYIDRFAIVYR